jgi:hypothetical protein
LTVPVNGENYFWKNRRKSAGSAKTVLCKYQLYFEPA